MAKVVMDITMSLDGFIAGPGITQEVPMGIAGHRLHDWLFTRKTELDSELLKEVVENSGAVIVGGHTYTIAIEGAWEKSSPFSVPAFVVCHQLPSFRVEGFTFITDGLPSVMEQAGRTAGAKDIWVMGGADVARQCLYGGWVDEIHIHIAPILLKKGTRLFTENEGALTELEIMRVLDTPGAVHIYYKVRK